MAYNEDQLVELIAHIKNLVKAFGGGGESPMSSAGTSKAKSPFITFAKNMADFRDKLDVTTGAIKTMSREIDKFSTTLQRSSKDLGVLASLSSNATTLTQTLGKMEDASQSFVRTLPVVTQQTTRFGMALEEAASLASHNSVLTKILNRNIERTTSALDKLSTRARSSGASNEQQPATTTTTEAAASLDMVITTSKTLSIKQDVLAQVTDKLSEQFALASRAVGDLINRQNGNITSGMIAGFGELASTITLMTTASTSAVDVVRRLTDQFAALGSTVAAQQTAFGLLTAHLNKESATPRGTAGYQQQLAAEIRLGFAGVMATLVAWMNNNHQPDSAPPPPHPFQRSARKNARSSLAWQKRGSLLEELDAWQRNLYEVTDHYDNGDTGQRKRKRGGTYLDASRGMDRFRQGVDGATQAVQLMHGGVDDFREQLYRLGRQFAVVSVFVTLFEGGLKMVDTFNKLSDIGQSFHGSILEMSKQAGAAGLSLQQFAELQIKHSVLAKVLEIADAKLEGAARHGLAGTLDVISRDLKEVDYFGMSLSELSGATGDYLETLRLSGQLTRLHDGERATAVEDMLRDVTQWTHTFGVSRTEILKTLNDIMQQPAFAARIGGDKKLGGLAEKYVGFLASIPGQQENARMFGEAFRYNVPLTAAGARLPQAAAMQRLGPAGQEYLALLEKYRQNLRQQMPMTPEMKRDFFHQLHDLGAKYAGSEGELLFKAAQMPELRDAADALIGSFNQIRNFGVDQQTGRFSNAQYDKDVAAAEKEADARDKVTETLNTFDKTFNQLSGQFRLGFYGALIQAIGGAGKDHEEQLDSLGKKFLETGTALGKFIAPFLQDPQKVVDATVTIFSALLTLAKGILWVAGLFSSLGGKVGKGVDFVFGKDSFVSNAVHVALPILETILFVVLGVFLKRLFGILIRGLAKGAIAGAGYLLKGLGGLLGAGITGALAWMFGGKPSPAAAAPNTPETQPKPPEVQLPKGEPIVPPAESPKAEPVAPQVELPKGEPIVPPVEAPKTEPVAPQVELPKGEPIVPPVETPKTEPVEPVAPRVEPIVPPVETPKVELPKAEPVAPQVELPKGEPIVPPVETPKTEPVEPVAPQVELPKGEPIVPPVETPKIELPKTEPVAPQVELPKGEPIVPPVETPKVELPKTEPVGPQVELPKGEPIVPPVETPKAEPVEPVAPQVELPKGEPIVPPVETPKAELPKAEPVAPQVELPKGEPIVPPVETPKVELPKAEPVAPRVELPKGEPIVPPINPIESPIGEVPGLFSRVSRKFMGSGFLRGVGVAIIGELTRWGTNSMLDGMLKGVPGHDAIKNTVNSAITGTEWGFNLGGPIGALYGVISGAVSGLFESLDSKDTIGKWMDKNIPGAAWFDNLLSHLGLGLSYEDQKKVEQGVALAPQRGILSWLSDWLDSKDTVGKWMDTNVPGASWLDDLMSHLGYGLSYEDQKKVAQGIDLNAPQQVPDTLNEPYTIDTIKPAIQQYEDMRKDLISKTIQDQASGASQAQILKDQTEMLTILDHIRQLNVQANKLAEQGNTTNQRNLYLNTPGTSLTK